MQNILFSNYSKKTYTLNEFLTMVRIKEENEKLNREIRRSGAGEILAKKINADPRLRKMVVFVTGSLLYLQNTIVKAVPNVAPTLGKINAAGNTFFSVVTTIGYWICLIMCIVEIIKCLSNGDTKQISKIIFKYLMAFGAFFIVPWLFDLIKATFAN